MCVLVNVKRLAVFDDAPLEIIRQGLFFLFVDAPLEEKLLIESSHGKRQKAAELAENENLRPTIDRRHWPLSS